MSAHPFLRHEALHSAYIAMTIVETHVVNSAVVQDDPQLLAKAQAAVEAVAELYQAIGADVRDSPYG